MGILAALSRQKWQDQSILLGTLLGLSIPSFLIATLLQYFFAMQWDLFPVARWGSFNHTILPSWALAIFPLSVIALLTRNHLTEVMRQDYILTAKSKGLTSFQVIWKHGLPNALLPIISYMGPLMAATLPEVL